MSFWKSPPFGLVGNPDGGQLVRWKPRKSHRGRRTGYTFPYSSLRLRSLALRWVVRPSKSVGDAAIRRRKVGGVPSINAPAQWTPGHWQTWVKRQALLGCGGVV